MIPICSSGFIYSDIVLDGLVAPSGKIYGLRSKINTQSIEGTASRSYIISLKLSQNDHYVVNRIYKRIFFIQISLTFALYGSGNGMVPNKCITHRSASLWVIWTLQHIIQPIYKTYVYANKQNKSFSRHFNNCVGKSNITIVCLVLIGAWLRYPSWHQRLVIWDCV